MKQSDQHLYFIALIPQEPIYSDITAIKREVKERYNSSAALRSPPHITLHMPFKWSEKKEVELLESLTEIANSTEPFKLELKDFNCFEPRVIYINVVLTEHLERIEQAVKKTAKTIWHIYPLPRSRAFQPHITIAFRDLKKPQFKEAWAEFSQCNFIASMEVSDLTLLRHNGKTWDIYHKIPLRK